jgi:DNA-binding transcriptional regulator GbsR (MarR family)
MVRKQYKRIKYDLELLLLLQQPTSVYAISKRTNYPYSSVSSIIHEYLTTGVVELVAEEPTRTKIYTKKHYQLSDVGRLLLKMVRMLERDRQNNI